MNTASIALVILGTVALAVLLAAACAIFGKPYSPESRKRHRQVVSGFAIAGGILLGAPRITSRAIAFVMAAASFALIALFVQRWAKYFAGWMA